jgi:hypothetical protein
VYRAGDTPHRARPGDVVDLYVWKVLRRDLGMTRSQTEAAVMDLVGRVTRTIHD